MNSKVIRLLFLIIAFEISLVLYGQDDNVHIDFPEVNVMYVGYPVKVSISFNDHIEDSLEINCETCDIIKKLNGNTWLIQSEFERKISLQVVNSKGEILKQTNFTAKDIPNPKLFVDSLDASYKITTVPSRLNLALESDIPATSGFYIVQWTIQIDEKSIVGSGNLLSDAVKELLEKSKSGFIVFDIQYLGPFGGKNLKEIFEFNLN